MPQSPAPIQKKLWGFIMNMHPIFRFYTTLSRFCMRALHTAKPFFLQNDKYIGEIINKNASKINETSSIYEKYIQMGHHLSLHQKANT